jgi:hypothetical protein
MITVSAFSFPAHQDCGVILTDLGLGRKKAQRLVYSEKKVVEVKGN